VSSNGGIATVAPRGTNLKADQFQPPLPVKRQLLAAFDTTEGLKKKESSEEKLKSVGRG
jgi:hypothetical protein